MIKKYISSLPSSNAPLACFSITLLNKSSTPQSAVASTPLGGGDTQKTTSHIRNAHALIQGER